MENGQKRTVSLKVDRNGVTEKTVDYFTVMVLVFFKTDVKNILLVRLTSDLSLKINRRYHGLIFKS